MVLGMVASSNAAVWAPAAGADPTSHYTYSNGKDIKGLFGNPVVGANKFVFSPSKFIDNSSDANASATDTVSVDIKAGTGRYFQKVVFEILGDYSLLGNSKVTPSALAKVTNLDTAEVVNANLVFVPASPISTTTSADGNIDIIGAGYLTGLPTTWTNIHVDLSATATATGLSGGTSLIEYKEASISPITVAVVPEPVGASMLMLGAGALLLRRRR